MSADDDWTRFTFRGIEAERDAARAEVARLRAGIEKLRDEMRVVGIARPRPAVIARRLTEILEHGDET